jgi:glycosyltransferase involved in cell wall biosynthesis
MISFVVTTHNEGDCINVLMKQLSTAVVTRGDEIVIVDDYSDDPLTQEILAEWDEKLEYLTIYPRRLDGDFAAQKNFAIEMCTQPWIFQIDADELLGDYLEYNIHEMLENNPDIDLFLVPRVNVVDGLTEVDVQNFGWQLNEYGWVMWPDYQHRIFKNKSEIRWKGKVHETMSGVVDYTPLPIEDDEGNPYSGWALIHIKDVVRQRKQNELYANIQRSS